MESKGREEMTGAKQVPCVTMSQTGRAVAQRCVCDSRLHCRRREDGPGFGESCLRKVIVQFSPWDREVAPETLLKLETHFSRPPSVATDGHT